MQLYDVTMLLRPEMATYPGEPGPSLTPIHQISRGDAANVSKLTEGVHSGTHIDAPVHFFDGRSGVDQLPLDALVGPCVVVAVDGPAVTAAALAAAGLPRGTERVLFKTPNERFLDDDTFHRDFTYIDPGAAMWLVAHNVRLTGIDYLSVEQFGAAEPRTHRTLLGASVVIIEGLDLRAVEPGAYGLIALPIKLQGSDGAPARVLLTR